MYDWLKAALADESSFVVTANRRLARTLVENYGQIQIDAGRKAWRRPPIYAWGDWLSVLLESAHHIDDLPIRINGEQSRVLWEQSLAVDVDDPLVSIGGLARMCRDTWLRLHQWRVPLIECQKRANGQDQRIFARAAGHYSERLSNENWIDDGQIPALLAALFTEGKINSIQHVVLAGFDRITPQVQSLIDAIVAAGATTEIAEQINTGTVTLNRFANEDAELRAAGAWARAELESDPDLQIAIVISNLEQNAEHSGRLLREGLMPGWQYSDAQGNSALDVSYGRRLVDYPAIYAALIALRWMYTDISGTDLSLLLRSPFFGLSNREGRSRLELLLRDMPDRQWSRKLLLRALAARDDSVDAVDWLTRIAELEERLSQIQSHRRPSDWAEFYAEVLKLLNWPGEGALSSADFQLDNRWRNLLNEFSRLELVSPQMSGPSAVARLAAMAGDTIFQPESEEAVVRVMGPLEAAGLQFDRLWVTGLAAVDWPPAGQPLVLLSRDLQRDYGMPDADPQDTATYAQRVLDRLSRSSADAVFSYPAMIGDAEQLPSALLTDIGETDSHDDPGWHAETFLQSISIVSSVDSMPPVTPDETIAGGAATINRQLRDPFSAFAYGRLGLRWLPAFRTGIAANIRGNLIHAALYALYSDNPSQAVIRDWTDVEKNERINRAVDTAFKRHERFADGVLLQLLKLERQRTARLLDEVIEIDRQRAEFAINHVEYEIRANLRQIHLTLRCDRIDRLSDERLLVLDYKTGKARKFLSSGEPNDWQLVVYACVIDEAIAALGFFNVDSKHTVIDAVGGEFKAIDDWNQDLNAWKQTVYDAADEIAAGDVRLNIRQTIRESRPLNLLSRFTELRREQ